MVVRAALGVAAINVLIYAVRGLGEDNDILASMEVYDPKLDKWHDLSSMSTAQAGLGVGVLDGLLYACRGFNAYSVSHVEEYDPLKQAWEMDSPDARLLILSWRGSSKWAALCYWRRRRRGGLR